MRLHTSDREERELLKRETLADLASFDVVLTTYEMAASQSMRSTLCRKIHWRYLVLDEGHKIKNEKKIRNGKSNYWLNSFKNK